MPWLGQQGVRFRSSLDGTRFFSARPLGDKIKDNDFEEPGTESLEFAFGTDAVHGRVKAASGIDGPLETDASAGHVVGGGGFGDEALDEIVGDDVGQEFLAGHRWSSATKFAHAHG